MSLWKLILFDFTNNLEIVSRGSITRLTESLAIVERDLIITQEKYT